MKKIILEPKSQFDKGTYILKNLCGTEPTYWDDTIVWDYQKTSIVKDLKREGFKVFEPEWSYDKNLKEVKNYKEI